ncbi:MAG: cytochrome c biogenesis protein CcsA [Gammaproteobacteria bacterium]|nr:cytochrome c biogenesis protein CcsA [Gammaproteobacteria bacterium]
MTDYIFTLGGITFYIACSILLFFHVKNMAHVGNTLSIKSIVSIGLIGLLLHALALHNSMFSPLGIDLGFYNAMSLITAFIVLLILIATWRHPVEILAIILLPIASIILMFELTNSSSHILSVDTSSALIFHILTSILAYSLLTLAALQAVLLSIQNRLLHSHQPSGAIQLLPPLKNMETLLFEVIIVGFFALTISLGSGLIFLENMFAQHLVHKTVLSILAWFVFLILLIGHWKLGWRGRTAIRWTLSGFVSLMLAYFGSKFALEIVLA